MGKKRFNAIRKIISRILGNRDDILPFEKFFSPIEKDNGGFYIRSGLRDGLYLQYRENTSLRDVLNKFLIEKKTENVRFRNVLFDAINCKESIVIGIHGNVCSGKNSFVMENILPLFSILQERNIKINTNIEGSRQSLEWKIRPDYDENLVMNAYITRSTFETFKLIDSDDYKDGDFIFQDGFSKKTSPSLDDVIGGLSIKKPIILAFTTPEIIKMQYVDYYLSPIAIDTYHGIKIALLSNLSNHVGIITFKLNDFSKLTN